jgi:hypothetical protein
VTHPPSHSGRTTLMNPSTFTANLTRPGIRTTLNGRRVSVAGATYVTAWVVGLTGPAAPAATAGAGAVHAYYAEHGPAILVQSSLIHGIAGAALVVLALVVPAATGATASLGRAVKALGLAAAALSFLQVALAGVAVAGVEQASADRSAALFHALNTADTVKLVLLAAFAAVVTVAADPAGMAPRWLRALTVLLVVLLPFGGAAFLVDSAVLTAMLYASLPVLLLWAGAVAFLVGRRAH